MAVAPLQLRWIGAPGEDQPAGHNSRAEKGDVQLHVEGGGATRQREAHHVVGYDGGRARCQQVRQAAAVDDRVRRVSLPTAAL